LEESESVSADAGWIPRHVVIWEGEHAVAASPCYLKLHSMGEFVYDWSWANAARQVGCPYYPKLVAAVPFTPVTGARLLVAADQDRAAREQQLVAAMHTVAQQVKAAGVHVLFCTEAEQRALAGLGAMARVQSQYHWFNHGYADFGDFLSRFRSKRRKAIRRERRKVREAGVSIEALTGEALTPAVMHILYGYYRQTCSRYGGWDYLQRPVWELLSERWPDRVVAFVARMSGEIVAGAFCVFKGDRLLGRYWGCRRGARLPDFLHFELCYYAPIAWCIERGAVAFEPGQGGEHKFSRGFEPTICRSAHWLFDSRLADPIRGFLIRERAAVEARVAGLLAESPIRLKE